MTPGQSDSSAPCACPYHGGMQESSHPVLCSSMQALLHAPLLRQHFLSEGHPCGSCARASGAAPCLSCELVRRFSCPACTFSCPARTCGQDYTGSLGSRPKVLAQPLALHARVAVLCACAKADPEAPPQTGRAVRRGVRRRPRGGEPGGLPARLVAQRGRPPRGLPAAGRARVLPQRAFRPGAP